MGGNWGGEMDPECSSFDRLDINLDVTEHCDVIGGEQLDVIGGEHCDVIGGEQLDVIGGDETEESLGASWIPF